MIGMLGAIFRCVHGDAHPDLRALFERANVPTYHPNTRRSALAHNLQLVDPLDGSHSELLARSVWGLIAVWNRLPQKVVDGSSVSKAAY